MSFCFLVVCILTLSKIANGVGKFKDRWKYCHDKNRPLALGHDLCENQWTGICKTGRHQSPINIIKKKFIKTEITAPFVFNASRLTFPILKIENNGHTLKVSPKTDPDDHYTMSGVTHTKICSTIIHIAI